MVDLKAQKDGGASKTGSDLDSMKEVFVRSPEAHAEAMASMMQTMSVTEAMDLLRKDNMTTPALVQIGDMALGRQGNLRQPKGYAGLDSARKLLNDMIYEAAMKYDEEIASCTDFYSQQCAALQAGQSDLLACNYISASSRTLASAASATIERCRQENRDTRDTLHDHKAQCTKQKREINSRLKVVMGDIEILTKILQMTDCKETTSSSGTGLLQLRRCHNECTNSSVVEFAHHSLQEEVSKLQSHLTQSVLQDTMADMYNGIDGLRSIAMLQDTSASNADNDTATAIYVPPTPKTQKLGACSDPYEGGPPPPGSKRAAGCKLTTTSCEILQGRFLRLQSGVVDEKEALMARRDKLERACERTSATLQSKIDKCSDTIMSAQTDLADAQRKEADAEKECIDTTEYNQQLNSDVKTKMATCRSNYAKYEGEMCALRKIRGELYKVKGKTSGTKHASNGFFTDCSMGEWVKEQCTKSCGGGEQNLTREIASAPNGGMKCLPERQLKSCNNQECPVDCIQEPWSGWSKCTAECGGGVKQRLRRTERPMRYGGQPCGDTKQEIECNSQACDEDCQLSQWTKWGGCSKDCGGGTRKRYRYVLKAATGRGHCPGRWDEERLQYRSCAMKRCRNGAKHNTFSCTNGQADIVLLLDGSTSMSQKGWDAEVELSKKLVQAFTEDGVPVQAEVSVIVYSGPRYWSQWKTCFTRRTVAFATRMEACGIKTITDLTNDLADVQTKIADLKTKWPKGGTLTSRALKAAEDQLQNGRVNTKANVIVLTDGRPMSTRWTRREAKKLRRKARLLWVPITRNAPLYQIKKWATRRWQENVFEVKSFTDLAMQKKQEEIVTHVVSSICPHNPFM